MITIGAGGGSMAWIEVAPDSGLDPGARAQCQARRAMDWAE